MIQANELRIGNLVNTPDPNANPFRVESIESIRIGCSNGPGSLVYWDRRVLELIPLTEEWLLKFGFIKFDNGCISAKFCIGNNPITHEYLVELTWLKDYTNENFEPYPFYKNGYHQIKYIHQLQNLYFALTGEELTPQP